MSLKAEVAARLVYRDPDRAAAEMGEVASVARAALSDVRETVSGYRIDGLNSEIETATTLLSAASVTVTRRGRAAARRDRRVRRLADPRGGHERDPARVGLDLRDPDRQLRHARR